MLQINNDGQKYNPGNGCHKKLDPSGLRGISFVGALGNTEIPLNTPHGPHPCRCPYGTDAKGRVLGRRGNEQESAPVSCAQGCVARFLSLDPASGTRRTVTLFCCKDGCANADAQAKTVHALLGTRTSLHSAQLAWHRRQ